MSGPENFRLVQLVDAAHPRRIARHAEEWQRCARILDEAAATIERIAARHVEIGGRTGPSMARSFLVAAEVLAQCDGLDGVRDGIITEPDACTFRPEALLCRGEGSGKCLTLTQVDALRTIYAPLYGDGELLYLTFDSPPEGDTLVVTYDAYIQPAAQRGKDGSVSDVKVLKSSNQMFDQACVDAVRQWRFTPGNQDVILTVSVNFTLK